MHWGRAPLGCAGLLAGVAARAQRREYMQLLSDCQRLYCEARLALVADVVAMRMAEYMREPLPSLTRSGCSYLMQVCPLMLVLHSNSASSCICMLTCRACHEFAVGVVSQGFMLTALHCMFKGVWIICASVALASVPHWLHRFRSTTVTDVGRLRRCARWSTSCTTSSSQRQMATGVFWRP